MDPINYLANLVGASTPAFKLLISMFLCIPLAQIYKNKIENDTVTAKHNFFIASGFCIGFFNFGFDIFHSVAAVLITHLIIRCLHPGKACTIVLFTFNFGYLLAGYHMTESEKYDITWTLPHCIITLKLISIAFNISDGSKSEERLSISNRATALKNPPTLKELAGYIYFPSSFLVGPQFPMVRYMDFVTGKLNTREIGLSSVKASFKRAILGVAYLITHQIGTKWLSDDFLLSEEFHSYSFLYKHVLIGIWGKITLYKYISIWILSESLCIIFGISYNGVEGSRIKWDACRNINVQLFELCTRFGQYIESFNINTNLWAAQYIYKRLAFLGNKFISQGVTLAFLALWHGFYSGYYMTFFMEFIIMFMEKDIEHIISNNNQLKATLNKPIVSNLIFILLKIYTIVFMGYCMIPFALKVSWKWWSVYRSLYFSGFIFFLPWAFLYKPLVLSAVKKYFPRNLRVD